MEFGRASENEKKFLKYEKSFIHNTALVAWEEKKVIGILEYEIRSIEKANIINFSIVQASGENIILKGFIEEIAYWNPHLKRILWKPDNYFISEGSLENVGFVHNNQWFFNMNDSVEAFKISIDEIIPEQLTIDRTKLEMVSSWIEKPEDVILCCVNIEDKIVSIDGHSRLVAAYNKGFKYVYAYMDQNNDNIEFYKICLDWCQKEGICSVRDLAGRVVITEEHERLWINRCQKYLMETQGEDK